LAEEKTRLTHVGLIVSDIERSTGFYRDALGFEVLSDTIVIGQEFGKLSGEENLIRLRFIRRDNLTIELLSRSGPSNLGPPARDRFGLWHMCLNVPDIDAQISEISKYGGKARPETRTMFDLPGGETMEIVYCEDPDGQPVELTRMADSVVGDFVRISQGKART
jgi:catechol 2,3-dioxygenase-like lactoylglutathione lyase family enzyme